jgi:DMSO/TMAO reductase YedYZ molybdopterin-dependent catalytic subunit
MKMWILTLRSLLVGAVLFGAAIFGLLKVFHQPHQNGIPATLRQVHEANGRLWKALLSQDRKTPSGPLPPSGTAPRFNGNIGLNTELLPKKWRLRIFTEEKLVRTLSIHDIRWLPQTHTSTQFFCVEGWSTFFSYSGVRFSDFMKIYGIDTHYQYVGLDTPNHQYYVSIDMDSMLHPQTLLAYEMNEKPLAVEHGAPLRLMIPIKYGIKSLKRIGSIRFSNHRPHDYWEERGYDWFAGL